MSIQDTFDEWEEIGVLATEMRDALEADLKLVSEMACPKVI